MRRATPVALVLILAGSELASQTSVEPGTLLVGGRARFSRLYDAGNDLHEIGFELAPDVGVFIWRGVAVSMNARLGWSRREDTSSATKWGVGPGISYYLARPGWRVYPYAELATLWLKTNFSPIGDEPVFRSQENREWTWVGSLGAVLLLARNVGLSGEAYYSRYRVEATQIRPDGSRIFLANRSEEYGLRFGIRVFLF